MKMAITDRIAETKRDNIRTMLFFNETNFLMSFGNKGISFKNLYTRGSLSGQKWISLIPTYFEPPPST